MGHVGCTAAIPSKCWERQRWLRECDWLWVENLPSEIDLVADKTRDLISLS